jgi:hypothetical protein
MTRARDLSKLLGTNNNGVIDNTNITLDANEIPNLDASKITTGTFAYSKLNLASSITNSDISSTAGIASSKLGSGTVLQVLTSSRGEFALSALNIYTRIGTELTLTPVSASSTWHIFLLCNGFQADATGRGLYQAYLNNTSGAGNAGTLVAHSVGAMNVPVSVTSTQSLQSICISSSFASFAGTKYIDLVVLKADTGTNTRFGMHGRMSVTCMEVR